jgi:hypothetical protein
MAESEQDQQCQYDDADLAKAGVDPKQSAHEQDRQRNAQQPLPRTWPDPALGLAQEAQHVVAAKPFDALESLVHFSLPRLVVTAKPR